MGTLYEAEVFVGFEGCDEIVYLRISLGLKPCETFKFLFYFMGR